MTHQEYNVALKKLSFPYGVRFFAAFVLGGIATLYVADRVANASSWPRELVLLAMLPAFLAPVIVGSWLMSVADRRLGLRCSFCSESLSMGSHVPRLRKCGGACPKCGALVVDPPRSAEPGDPPNAGSASLHQHR